MAQSGEIPNKSGNNDASDEVQSDASSDASSGPELASQAVGDRIAQVRGRGTQDAFAAEMGIAKSTLSRYERGERAPDVDFLTALAVRRRISSDWVLFGRLPSQLRDGDVFQPLAAHSERVAEEAKVQYASADLVFVKQYGVEVGGGRGVIAEYERVVAVRAFSGSWIKAEFDAEADDLFIVTVRGDSMAGVVNHGDIILVDRRDTAATTEDVYVVRVDGQAFIKNLQRLPGGIIKVWSENERVAGPFEVKEDDIGAGTDFEILGRVLWRGGKIRR